MGVFTGKTAVVTGASSGIGRAIALRLGEAGAHVFAPGRRKEALADTVAAVAAAGGTASAVAADLRDPGEVQGLVDRAMADTGRLDVMVNNAGVSFLGPLGDGDPEAWREMLEINVLALAVGSRVIQAGLRRFLESTRQRMLSLFTIGIRWVMFCLTHERSLPKNLSPVPI